MLAVWFMYVRKKSLPTFLASCRVTLLVLNPFLPCCSHRGETWCKLHSVYYSFVPEDGNDIVVKCYTERGRKD